MIRSSPPVSAFVVLRIRCSSAIFLLLCVPSCSAFAANQYKNARHPLLLSFSTPPPSSSLLFRAYPRNSPPWLDHPLRTTISSLWQQSDPNEGSSSTSSRDETTTTQDIQLEDKSQTNGQLQQPQWVLQRRAQRLVLGIKKLVRGISIKPRLPRAMTRRRAAAPANDKTDSSSSLFNDTASTTYHDEMTQLPQGPRWAISHPSIDLSGTWRPVINAEFKREYEQYLKNCGTSLIFRNVCLKFCGTTREIICQIEQGRILELNGKSPAGGWQRTLVSSGACHANTEFEAVHVEFLDPDKERVRVESWWEQDGQVHKSFLRNKPGVNHGEFESARYLERSADGTVHLVCESTFHPSAQDLENPSSKFQPAFVQWRYQREP